jgi:Trp operon repressor
MNETLIRSPNDERSIQKTDHESITMMTRGMMTRRTMKKDFRRTSMLTMNAEATPSRPA